MLGGKKADAGDFLKFEGVGVDRAEVEAEEVGAATVTVRVTVCIFGGGLRGDAVVLLVFMAGEGAEAEADGRVGMGMPGRRFGTKIL